jgi:hypothetical protein
LGVGWSFESGFTGFRGFLRVGVGWGFESGFTGFRGFFSVRRWIGMMRAAAYELFFINHFFHFVSI